MVNLIAIFLCNIMTIWSFGGWLTYHNNIMDFSIVLQRLKKCLNLLHSLAVFVIIHLWKELCLPLKLAILRIALCNVISLWDHGNIWRLKTVYIGRFYSRQNCQYQLSISFYFGISTSISAVCPTAKGFYSHRTNHIVFMYYVCAVEVFGFQNCIKWGHSQNKLTWLLLHHCIIKLHFCIIFNYLNI